MHIQTHTPPHLAALALMILAGLWLESQLRLSSDAHQLVLIILCGLFYWRLSRYDWSRDSDNCHRKL